MNVGSFVIVGLGVLAFVACVGLYIAWTADPRVPGGRAPAARRGTAGASRPVPPAVPLSLRVVPDRPVPVFDERTGRLTHDDRCWGDEDHPDMCVCGLDEAEVDAMLLAIEYPLPPLQAGGEIRAGGSVRVDRGEVFLPRSDWPAQ